MEKHNCTPSPHSRIRMYVHCIWMNAMPHTWTLVQRGISAWSWLMHLQRCHGTVLSYMHAHVYACVKLHYVKSIACMYVRTYVCALLNTKCWPTYLSDTAYLQQRRAGVCLTQSWTQQSELPRPLQAGESSHHFTHEKEREGERVTGRRHLTYVHVQIGAVNRMS